MTKEQKQVLKSPWPQGESVRVVCTISTHKMNKAVQQSIFLFENAALPPDSSCLMCVLLSGLGGGDVAP